MRAGTTYPRRRCVGCLDAKAVIAFPVLKRRGKVATLRSPACFACAGPAGAAWQVPARLLRDARACRERAERLESAARDLLADMQRAERVAGAA